MGYNHSREPIPHTCPDIDKYIRWIKMEIYSYSSLKSLSESELFDAASTMSSKLDDCIGYLEELRKSNDTLRKWGIEEAEKVDELELQLEENTLS